MKIDSIVSFLFLQTFALATLPTVTISDGVLIGTTTTLPSATASVNKFLGVPFAAAPIGQLRFALPQSVQPYGTIQANKWSKSCMQQFINSTTAVPTRSQTIQLFNTPDPGESEDCLYLNVYVPGTQTTGKTVMFWIYGGGLEYGTASIPWHDGSSFAAYQDVIIVAPNYRTNVFGFPHSDEITDNTKWNIGYYDQRMALQWVKNNIKAFGGDPNKVTIFGQSSGATSVDRLVTTMGSNPPFRAAIMQSGTSSVTVGKADQSTTEWSSLVPILGCSPQQTSSPLACMRTKDATAIKSALEANYTGNFFSFQPIQDGVTELKQPEASRLAGTIAKVPILQGTTAQEGRLYSLPYNVQGGFNYWVETKLSFPGANFYNIIAAYPIPGTYPDNDAAVAQAWTDAIYQCPASVVTWDSATGPKIPTWRYYFNASFANYGSVPGFTNRGAYHTTDIPLVFGTYPSSGATAQEIALSQYMQTAWATFAKDPNGGPDPAWPSISSSSGGKYIGVLGNAGNTFTNLTVMQSTPLDTRCSPLYYPIYNESDNANSWKN